MTLHIKLVDCLVCRRELGVMRDQMNLDSLEEEGQRYASLAFDYILPKAAYRDRIASDICDGCWVEHREYVLRGCYVRSRNGRHYAAPPPFNQIYLWSWVALKLEEEAKRLGKEAQRLKPHLAEKADRGQGIVRKGPLRAYGPRRRVYLRGGFKV
jgi:hypothetical protein